jgi:hypothetical protein
MDLKSLIAKMDAIEQLDEVRWQDKSKITLKDVQTTAQGAPDENARKQALATLARDNGLPGLYDPMSGDYVDNTGKTPFSGTAPMDVDQQLAGMGLLPGRATTSTMLGRTFGQTSRERDAALQGTSQKYNTDREAGMSHDKAIDTTQDLLKQLQTMAQTRTDKAKTAAAGTAAGASANPVMTNPNTPTKESYLAEGLSHLIIEDLEEASLLPGSLAPPTMSGGTGASSPIGGATAATKTATTAAAKGIGKTAMKGIPFVGAAINGAEAYMYAKEGDIPNALLSSVGAVASFFPPFGTAIATGIGTFQTGKEIIDAVAGDGTEEKPNTNPNTNPNNIPFDPKVQALQKRILAKDPNALPRFGADGKMGPETQAAMKKTGISESQENMSEAERIASLRYLLDSIEEASGEVNMVPNDPEQSDSGPKMIPSTVDSATAQEIQSIVTDPSNPIEGFFMFANGKQGALVTDPESKKSVIVDLADQTTILAKGGEPTEFTVDDFLQQTGMEETPAGGEPVAEALIGRGIGFLLKRALRRSSTAVKRAAQGTMNYARKHPVAAGAIAGLAGLAGYSAYTAGRNNPVTPPGGGGGGGGGSNIEKPETNPTEPTIPPEEIALAMQLKKARDAMVGFDKDNTDKEIQFVAQTVDAALKPYEKYLNSADSGRGTNPTGTPPTPVAVPAGTTVKESDLELDRWLRIAHG